MNLIQLNQHITSQIDILNDGLSLYNTNISKLINKNDQISKYQLSTNQASLTQRTIIKNTLVYIQSLITL